MLLHNEIVDIFSDQYIQLGEEEISNMEQGAHTHLQQYQSFTDLKHSKDKSISCIDWHPTQKGKKKLCVNRATRYVLQFRSCDRTIGNILRSEV